MDRIRAEFGADRALFEDLDRRRQRAGAQQQRKIARRLDGKAAGNDAAAAEDRFADNRRADHLVVEHDREGFPHVLARHVAEALAAGGVEFEADHRLVVLERCLRVGQHVAADHDPFPDEIGVGTAAIAASLLGSEDFVARRQPAAACLIEGDGAIDELEGELGGPPEQRLDVLGIVDPRQLDEDAILTLALDRRLFSPGLVDAPADDLDRLFDRLPAARLSGDLGELHRAGAVAADLDAQVGVDLGERLPRVVDAVGIADREHDRVAFDIEPGIADLRIAQRVAHAVGDRVEALALRRGDIDLEQEVGAAAKVETERDLLVRNDVRQMRQLRRGEQIRQAQDHAERADNADQQDFPIGKIEHL